MASPTDRITFDELRASVQSAEPAALLVEPRILRRVIRLDRRLPGLGLFVPHRKSYTIERDRMLAFVDRSELDLSPAAELPRVVVLLAKPEDDESLDAVSAAEAMHRYWRLLFHARVHIELEKRIADYRPNNEFAAHRRQQIGEIEFAEIRNVLLKDDLLFPDPTDLETYVEFTAVCLELRYFSPDDLRVNFPAVRDWPEVDRILSQDIYHARLFQETRIRDAPARLDPSRGSGAAGNGAISLQDVADPLRPSPPAFWKLQAQAERASAVGNGVKAAILRTRAAKLALPDRAADARALAHAELTRLGRRLQQVLRLSDDEAADWGAALQPLLEPAARGFWSHEARLLYDLQKVCVESERGVFKLDLVEWCRTLGRRPLRRPLPLLRDVLITKYLRLADRRLATARLTVEARGRLSTLLATAVHRVEQHSRDQVRPLIVKVLDEVGLVPQNLPEQVARQKLVEELLDCIVENGFVNMGNLRDALSKNDLKLPDVTGLFQLLRGDRLLRADRRLSRALDGVYRHGAVYLRWPQRLSSLAFGTPFGRWMTQYVALPFGGAYLALAGMRHVVEAVVGHDPELRSGVEAGHVVKESPSGPGWMWYVLVLTLGTLFFLLMHRPQFRAWMLDMLWRVGQALRTAVVELPARVFRSPLVQRVLRSQTYAALRSYVLRPALFTAMAALPTWIVHRSWSLDFSLHVFFVVALFLNSPVGRYADEWVTDVLVRAWHELGVRFLTLTFQWIMDAFHRLLAGLERILYSVDEWARFRAGDNRLALAAKLVAGTGWFFVSYVVVFVFTLLVEPQVNPIKHFPVVTVSHKLILPTGPMFVKKLEGYIGTAEANTLVWSTIWLIPGVFGFLVWELKENWRLYAANRPRALTPVPIGHHGETMVRLLRPGFHSGTLPKLFGRLRRASRKAQRTGDMHAVDQQRAALQRVEECLRSFVDRELCGLLRASDLPLGSSVAVGDVRLATNRLDVELCRSNSTSPRVCLTWEEEAGRLRASVSQTGWLVELDESSRAVVTTALTGLFQRAGVDEVVGLIRLSTDPPVTWRRWVRAWSSPSVGLSAEDGSCESVVPSESAAGESVPATSIPVASSVDNR